MGANGTRGCEHPPKQRRKPHYRRGLVDGPAWIRRASWHLGSARRRYGLSAGGIVTAGLVMGCVAIPLSLGGLIVIPRMQDSAAETIELTQGDLSKDLTSLERSFNRSVNDLDTTLSDNVDESAAALEADFKGLERSSQKELEEVEQRLSAIVAELERTTGTDLSEFERSSAADLDGIESSLRDDVARIDTQVAEVEQRLAREQADLSSRLSALEGATSVAADAP